MAYPAPGVNLLRHRSLLAKPLPRAECVALGNARAVLYVSMSSGSNDYGVKEVQPACAVVLWSIGILCAVFL